MSELNYGSRLACQGLHDKGIVLETEAVWEDGDYGWFLRLKENDDTEFNQYLIPAPSMAEIWRELPQEYTDDELVGSLMLWKEDKFTAVGYWWHDQCRISVRNLTPADALIDLLIWVKKEEGT